MSAHLFLTRRAAPQARLKADAVKERGKGYSSSQLTQAGGKAYLFTDIENYGSLFVDNKCPTDVMARYLEVNHAKKGVHAWACNYGEVCRKFIEEYDEGTLVKHCEPMTKAVYSYYFPGLEVALTCLEYDRSELLPFEPTAPFRTNAVHLSHRPCALVSAATVQWFKLLSSLREFNLGDVEPSRSSSPSLIQNIDPTDHGAAYLRRSILNYAHFHQLDPETVTVDQVQSSPNGVSGWAETFVGAGRAGLERGFDAMQLDDSPVLADDAKDPPRRYTNLSQCTESATLDDLLAASEGLAPAEEPGPSGAAKSVSDFPVFTAENNAQGGGEHIKIKVEDEGAEELVNSMEGRRNKSRAVPGTRGVPPPPHTAPPHAARADCVHCIACALLTDCPACACANARPREAFNSADQDLDGHGRRVDDGLLHVVGHRCVRHAQPPREKPHRHRHA